MAPSALYRYFDGRDALLTALILDAYKALSDAAGAADAVAGPSPGRRWLAVGRALRSWAWEHRGEWGLVHGTPVLDYEAPPDTVEVGTAVIRLVVRMLADAHPGGDAELPVEVRVPRELHRWLTAIRMPEMAGLSDRLVVAGVVGFTYLLGAISTELFGQLGQQGTRAAAVFDAGLRVTGLLLGLPAD